MSQQSAHGRFVWFDLMTTDPDAARTFYRNLIGWDTQVFGDFPEPYHMWMRGGTPVGGSMRLPPGAVAGGAPTHWLPSIGTDDIEATVAAAKSLGATVMVPPDEIPDVGMYAVLGDPLGAVFALYQPQAGGAPAWDPQPGDFSWLELTTTDQDAAFSFYSDLFGWENTGSFDMGPMGTYITFGHDDASYGGIMNRPPEMGEMPPFWMCYIRVVDLDDAIARLRNGGGQLLNGPMDVPGGDRVAQCVDPQGGMFALHQVAAA